MGTAKTQSELWGARAQDWAEIQEGTFLPVYHSVLEKTGVGAGKTILDVGCGSGMMAALAAKRGAQVSGIDATPALIEIAKSRVPHGDFRAGEMEELPYADHSFDIITGMNSFQYAANPTNALRQARRVAKKEGLVVIAIWGKIEEMESAAYLAAIGSLLPPPPPNLPGPLALSQDGALQQLAQDAGLTPLELHEVDTLWVYDDEATALRGLMSPGPTIRAISIAGEQAVRDAILKGITPFRQSNGKYQLRNKFRYLIARA